MFWEGRGLLAGLPATCQPPPKSQRTQQQAQKAPQQRQPQPHEAAKHVDVFEDTPADLKKKTDIAEPVKNDTSANLRGQDNTADALVSGDTPAGLQNEDDATDEPINSFTCDTFTVYIDNIDEPEAEVCEEFEMVQNLAEKVFPGQIEGAEEFTVECPPETLDLYIACVLSGPHQGLPKVGQRLRRLPKVKGKPQLCTYEGFPLGTELRDLFNLLHFAAPRANGHQVYHMVLNVWNKLFIEDRQP